MKTVPVDPRFGPQPARGSALERRCRLRQSRYRVEVLKELRCGPWLPGRESVGSCLVDGHLSGLNFISPAAFAYAKQKVAEKAGNTDLTIDEFRLYNNMLSSMPMCFNLFSDLRAAHLDGKAAATGAIRRMFPEAPIAKVDQIEIEMIPRPTRDYIDDKTAFDAAVLFRDAKGRPGIVSIETKYADDLGKNVASKQERKHEIANELGLFTDEGRQFFAQHGYDQVARNLLLTFAYAEKHNCTGVMNYVLSLRRDSSGRDAVNALRCRLAPKFRDSIRWLSLEEAVSRAIEGAPPELAGPLRKFQQRYLDEPVSS